MLTRVRLFGVLALVALLFLPGVPAHARAVALQLHPPRLTADPGRPAKVRLDVTVSGASARARLVKIHTTVGVVETPKKTGPAKWSGWLRVPGLQSPTVALLYAEVADGKRTVRRFASLPISLRLELPVAAKAQHKVEVSIGGKTYGPVKARFTGTVKVPIVITPGSTGARVLTTAPSGVTKIENKPWTLPTFKRLLVAGPAKGDSGGTVDLQVFYVDKRGNRFPYDVRIDVTCADCSLIDNRGRRSVQTFTLKLPGSLGAVAVSVRPKGDPKSNTTHPLKLEASRQLKLKLTVTPKAIRIGTAQSVKVLVEVYDQFGHRADASVRVTVNLMPVSMAKLEKGRWRGFFFAPKTRQRGNRLDVVARGPRAGASRAIVRLLGGFARTLEVSVKPRRVIADGKQKVRVEVKALDRHGMPPSDKKLEAESEQGKMLYLDRVRPGYFRGEFLPKARPKGGVAKLVIQTRYAPAVTTKIRLIAVPQKWILTPLLSVFSNFGQMLGGRAALRLEYAVRRLLPAVYIGGEVFVGPAFRFTGIGGEADDVETVTAGVSVIGRMRLVQHKRFGFGLGVDVGLVGVHATVRNELAGGVIEKRGRGLAAFRIGVGALFGIRTVGLDELLLDIRVRYQTADLQTGSAENRGEVVFALGYRKAL